MFSDINAESTRRLTEAKSLVLLIKNEDLMRSLNLDSKVHKGAFFVLLYGALEYTITAVVQRCISILNKRQYDIHALKPTLYSLIFHKECNAIMDARDKKWTKRYELFSQLGGTKIANIEYCLFPTSIGNIKYSQLESIWNTFGITHDVVTDVKIKGRLAALADNRNAIAHGRELASVIGGRYTISEIECIYNDINTYCSYIITVFEDYITNEMYLIGH